MKKRKLTLFILVLIFLLPGMLAMFLYTKTGWRGFGVPVNHGNLMTPVEMDEKSRDGKWRLLLWYPGSCDSNCMAELDRLARIRLLLGRHLYRVELVLMTETAPDAGIAEAFALQDIGVLFGLTGHDRNIMPQDAQFMLQDPAGFLVMNYNIAADSHDIYRDIKHLLSREG